MPTSILKPRAPLLFRLDPPRRVLILVLLAAVLLLASSNPTFSQSAPGVTPISYTLPDGTRLTGYLSLPPNYQPGVKYPAILLIHGWHGVSRSRPRGLARDCLQLKMHQKYLNNKFVVFSGEYYAEYLGDHREFQSMAAALKTLADLPAVDAQRLAVVGASHGGYLALMCMMRPDIQPKPKVGVSISGVVDVADWVRYLQKYQGKPGLLPGLEKFARTTIPRAFGWPPEKDFQTRANFADISVLTYVKNLQGPVLLVHSANDRQVPISQAYMLRDALKQEKKTCAFKEIPTDVRDGHFIFQNSSSAWQEIADFLKGNL